MSKVAITAPTANREAELSIYRDRAETFGKACAEKDTQIAKLEAAGRALLAEFEKFSRYGSPMAMQANEAVQNMRALLATKESENG
jgi:hypothetical protein